MFQIQILRKSQKWQLQHLIADQKRIKFMYRQIKIVLLVGVIIGVVSVGYAKEEQVVLPVNRIEVYYLHNTFRCLSCNTIENLTKAAIFGGKAKNTKYKTEIDVKPIYKGKIDKKIITFKSVNIDEKENKHFLKDLKAEAKYPVLVEIKNGKIVRSKVLDEVWGFMDSNEKLVGYIQKNLDEFLK